MSVRVLLTTTDSAEEAERLASVLVDAHLAACVQIAGPVRSVFRWEGAVSVEPEWQLWLKTDADRVDDLTARLVAEHTYDVPEVLVLPVEGGHGPYLAWVTQETERSGAQPVTQETERSGARPVTQETERSGARPQTQETAAGATDR